MFSYGMPVHWQWYPGWNFYFRRPPLCDRLDISTTTGRARGVPAYSLSSIQMGRSSKLRLLPNLAV